MGSSANLKGIWNSIDNSMSELPDGPNLWERLREEADFAQWKPKKASGIVERRLESDREGEYYILKNPKAGTYLKLTDRDFYLWSLMDGTRSVKDLVVAYFTRYKSFAFARVGSLVAQLRGNLFLTDRHVNIFGNLTRELDSGTLEHRAGTLWRWFLNRELSLHDVDRYVSIAYRKFGWVFFTGPMKVLYVMISVLGGIFFVRQLEGELYPILRMRESYGLGFLTVLAIYMIIVLIHECAHAFAAKSYGRDIRRGGFLMYFGIPAFFVDTMDMWMEPRRARMAVSWAGPYSQLISGGLCSVMAALFPGTTVGSFLFKFAFFSYLSVFFNLNPLLEMDGYFMLMDWLEIPLLRRKSLNFVRKTLWSKLLQREKFGRDDRIFAVFGILVGIWSVCAVFIAIYLWRQRVFGALAGVLEKGPAHGLYLGAIALILGVPLLVTLAMKMAAIVYAAFVWVAENRYLKENRNLITLLVGISICLAVVSYFVSGLRFEIYEEIFKLMVLLYALFFAVKDTLYYREGRLETTFELLMIFILLLFAAELMGAIGLWIYGSRELLDEKSMGLLVSVLRVVAYVSLFLSMSVLAIRDFGLCHWGERLTSLSLLAIPSWLVFTILRWGLRGTSWEADLFPLLRFLSPAVLVPLALVLLIPSCFVYRRTEFRIAWLVLAISLAAMSTASILRFYEENHIVSPMAMSATCFYILGYSMLASALFGHYIVYTRVRSTGGPEAGEFAFSYDDKQRLRNAFADMCGAIFSQFTSIYGERVTGYIQDKLNRRSREAGWELRTSLHGIEHNTLKDFGIISLGEVYRGFFSRMLDLMSGAAGRTFVRKAMQRSWDRLYWEEREVADEHLLSPLERGRKLAEEFRVERENLMNVLGMGIFSGLGREEISLISSRLQTERFRKGTEIVRQGDMGDKLYIIESGEVEVSVHDDTSLWKRLERKGKTGTDAPVAEGTERIVARMGEGGYFGEVALLADVPRTATCRAVKHVEAWVLSKRDFDQLVRRHLDLPEKLDRAVANMTMLKRMPLFREFNYRQINMISSMLRSEVVPAGTVIVRQGDPGDAFYVIRSGEVVVTAGSEAGEKVVAKLGEAEYFGEIALISDQPRTATVTSLYETELLVLEKSDFDTMVGLLSPDLEQAGSRRLLDTRRKLGGVWLPQEKEKNQA